LRKLEEVSIFAQTSSSKNKAQEMKKCVLKIAIQGDIPSTASLEH